MNLNLRNIQQRISEPEVRLTVGFFNSMIVLSVGVYFANILSMSQATMNLSIPSIAAFILISAAVLKYNITNAKPPEKETIKELVLLYSLSGLTVITIPPVMQYILDRSFEMFVAEFFLQLIVIILSVVVAYFYILKQGGCYKNTVTENNQNS